MKELHYYAGGNTAQGFVEFFDSNFQELERLYILKGGPGTGKSTLIKSIGNEWLEKGYRLEWIHCSSDANSFDAVIIPDLKVGLVDGTNPHVIEPKYPGIVDDYVNLGSCWDRNILLDKKEEIITLTNKVKDGFQQAYNSFHQGLIEHDALEKIYIKNMNFEKANQVADEVINKLIPEKPTQNNAIVKHRFLGASTPDGPIDYVDNITSGVENRYLIKGRAGSGKSTMLKKIAGAASEKGYPVEVYHCGFDPNSLDMVIVRELNFAIFDSTAPHEYFPTREHDEIIDLYELTITPGTDEKFSKEIETATKKYKDQMAEGIANLAETKKLRDNLEQLYIQAMDFTKVNEIREEINHEIKEIAKK